ncbi:filamin-binding LIM protein 1 [Tachyglossus aculeatus]|uniref:filamin-binding LIM protein 1 n=1 Tax=Tachyglossus aculeatus TaxID=9261 RepID=UPI0018F4F6F9|nr:filamin-binding LIM protein 1 [Tachyglossus aculeatus]
MAGKPEKRVASSIFITLASPRRDKAVVEEVRQGGGAAQVSRPRDPASAKKAPGGGKPSNRSAGSPPSHPSPAQLSNGGSSFPAPIPDKEDAFPDLELLLPPPPPYLLLAGEEEEEKTLGSDLQQLHLVTPLPPPQAPAKDPQGRAPPNPTGHPERDESPDICAFCHKVITPHELGVEAMKRQYHAQCFTCRTCHCQLAGQRFYQRDGRPLCEPCYQDTLEKCAQCHQVILEHITRAVGLAFHPDCFTCMVCARPIGDENFALDDENQPYCLDDFYRKFAPVCSSCENPIIPRDGKDTFKIECMGRNFHENCYRCEDCRIPLSIEPTDKGCYPLNDRLFCKPCHVKQSAAGCC